MTALREFPPTIRLRGDLATELGRAIDKCTPEYEARIRADERMLMRRRIAAGIAAFFVVAIAAVWRLP